MISVGDEIECSPQLRRTLSRVQAGLASLGLTADFERFLVLWDAAIARSDFTHVAAAYPELITAIILKCRAGDKTEPIGRPTTFEGHYELIRFVFAPSDKITVEEGDVDFDDGRVGLGSILESMEQFGDPSSYIEGKTYPAWAWESADSETLNTDVPIPLWDFVFDLDVFLTNCLHVKHLVARHAARG